MYEVAHRAHRPVGVLTNSSVVLFRAERGASAAPVFTATTDTNGNYAQAVQNALKQALDAAMSALRNVDRLMSLHRADSELARLNRDGYLDHPDPRFVEVLKAAQATSALTSGAFDVTVQPLWHAAVAHTDATRVLPQVDWRKLQVSDERVRLRERGMAVTLNGIAQGYGADVALAALASHGITHALLDTGEFASIGKRDDGQPWTLAVRDPRDEHAIAHVLPADGRALATSGDYETTFSADFSRHHIFDPKTGKSPQELASVSVLAPKSLAKKPASGGMPASENISIASANAMPGLVRPRPARSSIFST